jgi:hypothetical protein
MLFFAGGVVANLHAQLDLSPREGVYIGEATPFPCVRFRDGAQVIRFMPPAGWRFAADGARCVLHFSAAAQATGSFGVEPLCKEAEASASERMERLLRESIPTDAANVSCMFTGLMSVKLDRWPARHAQATYEHFGQSFRIALVIVPLERQELHIRFGCRAADFDRVFTPFFESLGTFTWDSVEGDRLTSLRPNEATR